MGPAPHAAIGIPFPYAATIEQISSCLIGIARVANGVGITA
jgi:hypothetical protein